MKKNQKEGSTMGMNIEIKTLNINGEGKNIQSDNETFWNLLDERYGFGFSGYPPSFLQRRLSNFLAEQEIDSVEELQRLLLISPSLHRKLIQSFTVKYTEMFRDPAFFRNLRRKVLPFLSMYPVIKIWHAGCSTGEEVYSLAILLHELGMLEQTRIYGTDVTIDSIEAAKNGVYMIEDQERCERSYQNSGGKFSVSDYYSVSEGKIIFHDFLKKNMTFSPHNLVTGSAVDQFHLILCRNVLIYFNSELQEKVTQLFFESMYNLGYLAIGKRENLQLGKPEYKMAAVDDHAKIYRKVIF